MKNAALRFVLIIGIANFFADFTYEGARGIVGPFLGSLGASAAIVGFVAGLGELMGYGLRSVSGYLADKSHRHWAFAFLGLRSICSRFPHSLSQGDGRPQQVWWWQNASAEASANRPWKRCFHTPENRLVPDGSSV